MNTSEKQARVDALTAAFRSATRMQQQQSQMADNAGRARQAAVLELKNLGYSVAEIAAMLERSASRVGQLLTAARREAAGTSAARPVGKVYCQCGAAAQVQSSNPAMVDGIITAFWELHTGDGHGSTTPKKAAAARRREEAALRAAAGLGRGSW